MTSILTSPRATVQFLKLKSNYWGKNVLKMLTLLNPNIRGHPLLFDNTRKVLSFQAFFVLYVFINSQYCLRYVRCRPRNSLTGQRHPLKITKLTITQNRKWRHKKVIKFLSLSIRPENFMIFDWTVSKKIVV